MAEFKADLRDITKLQLLYKKFPRKFRVASKNLLNDLAFDSRGKIIKEIGRTMTVRSPGFVRGSVRVQKARVGRSLKDQRSIVGSVKRARFTGWIEQETGKKTQQKRIYTKAGRSGNFKRRAAPRFRAKPGKNYMKPSSIQLNDNDSDNVRIFLHFIRRTKFRGAWFVPVKYKRLSKGLYKFGGVGMSKIIRIHSEDVKQPERNPVQQNAIDKHIKQIDMKKQWTKALSRSFKI